MKKVLSVTAIALLAACQNPDQKTYPETKPAPGDSSVTVDVRKPKTEDTLVIRIIDSVIRTKVQHFPEIKYDSLTRNWYCIIPNNLKTNFSIDDQVWLSMKANSTKVSFSKTPLLYSKKDEYVVLGSVDNISFENDDN